MSSLLYQSETNFILVIQSLVRNASLWFQGGISVLQAADAASHSLLSGVTAPVTPCSLASAASSPATGTELNRPHPSAVPAPVLTETK